MYDETYSVEQLVTSSYIKYKKLSELIFSSYNGSNCQIINLFIDINSVLKQLFNGNVWTYKSVGMFEIAASILNMCGHYRSFFKGLGVYSKIYLIYGLNCPKANNVYVSGYNAKFIQSYIKKPDIALSIERNLNALNLICPYLPDIYFFDIGQCEVSAMVHKLISLNNDDKTENIIISKDPLMLQLIPEYDVRVLRPLKNKDGDNSFIVDNLNLWKMYISGYRRCVQPKYTISNTFFQNVLCMTSIPERSMFAIFNINRVFSIFNVLIQAGYLESNKLYSQAGINTALDLLDINYNPAELEMRFKAINTNYQSTYILPMENPELASPRLVNLKDDQSLKEILAKYFYKHPIELDKL